MSGARRFVFRLIALVRPGRAERELAREIASHLTALEQDYQRRGMPADEARAAARRAFGGIEQAKEHQRDARTFRWLDDAWRDLGYAGRTLCRTRAFTAVAVLTLALGIGANTAMFALVDAVLLRTLPVSDPQRLVVLDPITRRGAQNNASYPLFERLRQVNGVFTGVLAALDGTKRVEMMGPAGQPEPVQIQLVSAEYFSVLGAPALVGRTLATNDDRVAGPHRLAVLSFPFWKRRFGADAAAIGREVTLQGYRFTIVGVTRPGFFGEAVGRAPDLWVPLTAQPLFDRGMSLLDKPNTGWLRVIARLRPDIPKEQASAALALELTRLGPEPSGPGEAPRGVPTIRVSDGSRGLAEFRERFALPLRILSGVVGVILLIGCANVSSLLLARAAARQREVAVRLAIGADRARLVRQFLTESVVLAATGGGLGLLLAWWGSHLLLVLASSDTTPIPIDVVPGVRMLVFTSILSGATVMVFGLAPALSASRVDVGASMKAATPGRSGWSLPPVLVITQVALSLLLLTGAALLVQTLRNLRALDLGFAPAGLLQIRIVPESSGYTSEQVPELTRRIAARLSSVPGVHSVTMAHSGFASGTSRTCCIAVEGYTPAAGEDREIRTMGVGAGYFGALGIPLVRGHDFPPSQSTDRIGVPAEAIVNEAFARRYFPDDTAVGKHYGWGDRPNASQATEIIGVARNANDGDLRGAPKPLIYIPTAAARFFIVRAGTAPAALSATLRREIQALDSHLEFSIRPVADDIERALVREKLLAKLSGFFGVLAVVLSALGLYGLMAYTVVSRTREIGIRMAIGARPELVLSGELRAALRLVAIGMVIGMPLTLASGRLIASQLFAVSAADPAALALAAGLLVVVSTGAAYLPARRASRVDPVVALRAE